MATHRPRTEQCLSIAVTVLVVASTVVGIGMLSPVASAQSDALTLEGGDSKEGATTIGTGQTIELKNADGDNNWFKVPIDNDGTLVTLTIENGSWGYYQLDKIRVGNSNVDDSNVEPGREFQYVATESAVYINFDADSGLSGNQFTVTTQNPDQTVFKIEQMTVLPDTEFQPGESMTVQTSVFHDREQLLNTEYINATLTVGDRVIANKTVKGEVNATTSVQFSEQMPVNISAGQTDMTVHIRPLWAERRGNTEATTVTIEQQDIDGDGIRRSRELELGTDPSTPDTDGDGINDGRELEIGTDPTTSDSDRDGVDDGTELEKGADPLVEDTDDDGIGDAEEIRRGMDPSSEDSDGDGLSDARELELGTDPTAEDTDGDGLTDSEEIQAGSDPTAQSSREGTAGPLTLAGPDSTTMTNGNVTLEYTLSVSGSNTVLNGTSIELNGADSWTVADRSGEGTFRANEMQWLLLAVTSNENKTVSVTLSPPASAVSDGTATIEAVATDADGNQDTVTTEVDLDTVDVTAAIDQNDNKKLELVEIQRAVRLWRNDTPVPNTGGTTLDIETVQQLISIWADNDAI